MTCYSINLKIEYWGKVMDFFLLLKNMTKNIGISLTGN